MSDTKYEQIGGLKPWGHINCPDVLKPGWCFDIGDDGEVIDVCRPVDAKNPLRCSRCDELAVARDHMEPYETQSTLCRKHREERR